MVVVKVLFKDFPAKYIEKKMVYEHNKKTSTTEICIFFLKMLIFFTRKCNLRVVVIVAL